MNTSSQFSKDGTVTVLVAYGPNVKTIGGWHVPVGKLSDFSVCPTAPNPRLRRHRKSK